MEGVRFVKDPGWDEANPEQEWEKPRRATQNSAGYDFFAPTQIVIDPGESVTIKTYTKVKMPPNITLLMVPRSGLGFKYGIRLANTVGVIDADYYSDEPGKGCISVKLFNPSNEVVFIEKGKAYCQGIFVTYATVEDEDGNFAERNGEGFGSTDKNTKEEKNEAEQQGVH